MRRPIATAALVVGLAGLAGCSVKADEFVSDAQKLLAEQLGGDPGGTWAVTCRAPVDTKAGTTFACTAVSADEQRTFTGRIMSRAKYVLTQDGPATPLQAATPTTVG